MIYYDNAATTAMFDECIDEYKKYSVERYFNPSALYTASMDITNCMDSAREVIAKQIGANSKEIYFTASGTESDNMAMFGARKRRNSNIVITSGEHSAVNNYANYLEQQGYDIRRAPLDNLGRVQIDKLLNMIDNNTSFVSVMHVSNETGGINDIAKIAKEAKKINPDLLFHSDGVQAFCKVPICLKNSDIDFYAMSAHKIHGPKGVGALYIKNGINISPLLRGGGQEKGIRPATENVGGIMAFKKAIELFINYNDYYEKCYKIKQKIEYIVKNIEKNVILNSDYEHCVNNIISFAFKNLNGETLLHALEKYGILIGVGSACSSKSTEHRIAKALSLPKEYHMGMIRLSFSRFNTIEETSVFKSALNTELNKIIRTK